MTLYREGEEPEETLRALLKVEHKKLQKSPKGAYRRYAATVAT